MLHLLCAGFLYCTQLAYKTRQARQKELLDREEFRFLLARGLHQRKSFIWCDGQETERVYENVWRIAR